MPLRDYALPDSRTGDNAALTERQLLQSTVEIARHVFDAAASSVFLIDARTRELIFEAVSGAGESQLPGTRFPAGTGIVGWVAGSGQPMLIDDLAGSDVFAQDAARSTGYVPTSLMAAPLIRRDDCVGVMEVIDPRGRVRGGLGDLDLLTLLGTQAAISLDLLVRARASVDELSVGAPLALLDRIGDRFRTADPVTAGLVTKMLAAVDDAMASDGV
jgi:GAF domain-containing protein